LRQSRHATSPAEDFVDVPMPGLECALRKAANQLWHLKEALERSAQVLIFTAATGDRTSRLAAVLLD